MAFTKRFNNDFVLVENFKSFIAALFPNDKPCELLNPEVTKSKFVQFFAGDEYESFDQFEHSLKISKKRSDKKTKINDFIKTHNLEMYPHSAYSIFLNDLKTDYEKKNPGMKLNDIRKLMTKDWSDMDEKKKEKFITIFKTKKQEFVEQVRKIDPDFVSQFDKSMSPKAPLRPYNVYVQENMKVIKESNPGMNSSEIMKAIGQKWKALSDADKKKYYDSCGAEMSSSTESKTKVTKTTVETKKTTTEKVDKKKTLPITDEDSDVIEEEKKPKKTTTKGKTASISDTDESDAETKSKSKSKPKGKATTKTAASKIDEILDDGDE
jgi:hypothetical protein